MKQVYIANTGKDKNELVQFQSVSGKSRQKMSGTIQVKCKKLIIVVSVIIPLLWSCDFLNYKELEQYSQDEIFFYIDRTKNVLNNIYSYLPTDLNGAGTGTLGIIDGAMRSSASDDAVDVWDVSDVQKFNDGSWNSTVVIDDQWNRMYTAIRTANVFIDEAVGKTFPEIQYNDNYANLMTAYRIYPYEARFLRAFYYFELIKRYGDVPLDTTVLTTEEVNNVTQSTYDAVTKFIVRECDSAIAKLPVTYASPTFVSGETGRATKGAAMALKARVLIYAASPLHNPGNDPAKWAAAATASKAIIDQLGHLGNNTYSPLPAYTLVVNSLTSKELIWEVRQAAARTFEVANTAMGFSGGNSGTNPTQNLVDAYEMKTSGLGISEAGSGYNPADPYSSTGASARDPRLDMTILRNGSAWSSLGNSVTVQTYYNGINGPPLVNCTKTGYYLKKYMIQSINIGPVSPGTALHYWVIFRYGEVLLNYAEAMNEAYGPEVAGPAPLNNLTALQAVNLVRARTGVAMPAFPAGMTKAAFSTKLRNERRVELAFEDHRFWDLRRWKIGPSTTTIRGVNITRNATTGVLTFAPKTVETRLWYDRMYLYPIPQTELFINRKLVQNSGWEL
jgi:hypothetical protein